MFIARKSDHIQEDIKRNWSSWNFGQDGFKGTREELDAYLAECTDRSAVFVSGFEIYPDQLKGFEFGELYSGYWVAIDRENAYGGLSGIELKANNLQDAIAEAEKRNDYFGEGVSFSSEEAQLVYSNDDIHIFQID